MKIAGMLSFGASQQVVLTQLLLVSAQPPAMPVHAASGLPHPIHTVCSQGFGSVGSPSEVTVNNVALPTGSGCGMLPAVTQGVARQPPVVLPQSASVVHGPNLLAADRE